MLLFAVEEPLMNKTSLYGVISSTTGKHRGFHLSGCLPKILITQIGHKIDFLQILYVNYTLSGYFKSTFRLGSKCFLRQFTRGSSGGQKWTFYWYKNASFQ